MPTPPDAPLADPRTFEALTFDELGAGIGAAATVLRANATSAGLETVVPTCPGWSVSDLVAHVGMVHRWCADTLRGVRSDPAEHEAAGRAETDLLQWFDDGATEVLDVLSKTAPAWEGFFFLKNTPNARDGWARRQCHETTIHAVDAMAARLGRVPTVGEVWFSPALALDGIDELLLGFAPRRSSTLRRPEPMTLEVVAEVPGGTPVVWTVTVSEEPPSVERSVAAEPDVRWRAPARELYLALWNRGDGIAVEERTTAGRGSRALWTDLMRVAWS